MDQSKTKRQKVLVLKNKKDYEKLRTRIKYYMFFKPPIKFNETVQKSIDY